MNTPIQNQSAGSALSGGRGETLPVETSAPARPTEVNEEPLSADYLRRHGIKCPQCDAYYLTQAEVDGHVHWNHPPPATTPPETCPHCGAEIDTVFESGSRRYRCTLYIGWDGVVSPRSAACYERELSALRADNARLRGEVEVAKRLYDKAESLMEEKNARASDITPAQANELQDILCTLTASGVALITSAGQLRSAHDKRGADLSQLRLILSSLEEDKLELTDRANQAEGTVKNLRVELNEAWVNAAELTERIEVLKDQRDAALTHVASLEQDLATSIEEFNRRGEMIHKALTIACTAADGALDESGIEEAVAVLISQRDNARNDADHFKARVADLETLLDNGKHCVNFHVEEANELRARVATLTAALEKIEALSPADIADPFPPDWSEQIAACPECQGWAKNHPIQQGICDLHRKPLYERDRREKQQRNAWPYAMKDIARAALASDGSELLAAVREAREAIREIYDELYAQYDGVPDSTTLWMGRHIAALSVADVHLSAILKPTVAGEKGAE